MRINTDFENNLVTIDTQAEVEDIVVFNRNGEMVLRKTELQFSISELNNGLYIINIKTNSGMTIHRFIK